MKHLKTFEGFFDFFKKDKTENKPELTDQEFTENLFSKIKENFKHKNFRYDIKEDGKYGWFTYTYKNYDITLYDHHPNWNMPIKITIDDHEMDINDVLKKDIAQFFKSKYQIEKDEEDKEMELDKKKMKRRL